MLLFLTVIKFLSAIVSIPMHFALPGLIMGYCNGYKHDCGIMEAFQTFFLALLFFFHFIPTFFSLQIGLFSFFAICCVWSISISFLYSRSLSKHTTLFLCSSFSCFCDFFHQISSKGGSSLWTKSSAIRTSSNLWCQRVTTLLFGRWLLWKLSLRLQMLRL